MSDDSWNIQISFAGPGRDPLINVRGKTAAEVAGHFAALTANDVAQAISSGAGVLGAALTLAPLTSGLAGSSQAPSRGPSRPSSAPQNPGALEQYFEPDQLVCPIHGKRELYQGKAGPNAKNPGRPYVKASCKVDRNCQAIFGNL